MSRSYGPTPPSVAEKIARAATMVANTPPERLGALTADRVSYLTGAPLKNCEYYLQVAQARTQQA